jgi:hypothetical protein
MDVNLPAPIAAYVNANARLDAEAMLAAFSPNAVVQDDGGRHEGREEIKSWIRVATIENRAVFRPDAWSEKDGCVVVDGLTTGEFSGSPIRFTVRFKLDDGAIAALEIS